jgi:hypothetical protein
MRRRFRENSWWLMLPGQAPRPIWRPLVVVHGAAVAILAAAFLDTGTAAPTLLLTLAGAPWSLLLLTVAWSPVPWMLPLAATYQGFELILVATAVVNVGLHALAARRGLVVLSQIAARPTLFVIGVAVTAVAVAVPLAAYASYLGAGPTTVLLILVGGPVIALSVTAVGVGHRETISN